MAPGNGPSSTSSVAGFVHPVANFGFHRKRAVRICGESCIECVGLGLHRRKGIGSRPQHAPDIQFCEEPYSENMRLGGVNQSMEHLTVGNLLVENQDVEERGGGLVGQVWK